VLKKEPDYPTTMADATQNAGLSGRLAILPERLADGYKRMAVRKIPQPLPEPFTQI
jgi:hypothetical protein